MQKLLFSACLLVLAAALLHAQSVPNARLTPGAVRQMSVATICSTKWGLDRRHVTQSMKKAVCASYGAKNCPGPMWELDHLIPRELAGADVIANLWPQPIAEARVKDRLENSLHRQVCAGTISLRSAQKQMMEYGR